VSRTGGAVQQASCGGRFLHHLHARPDLTSPFLEPPEGWREAHGAHWSQELEAVASPGDRRGLARCRRSLPTLAPARVQSIGEASWQMLQLHVFSLFFLQSILVVVNFLFEHVQCQVILR
jgi:hypothetical protein